MKQVLRHTLRSRQKKSAKNLKYSFLKPFNYSLNHLSGNLNGKAEYPIVYKVGHSYTSKTTYEDTAKVNVLY